MKYSMDSTEEFFRLEKQATLQNYSVGNEMSFFEISRKEKILDAGCGSGVILAYIKSLQLQNELYGVDQSLIRIKQLKEKFGNEINLNQGDVESLNFKNDTFDQVYCRYVLEHLRSPHLAVQEFFRVLRPKGKLCLVDLDGILFNIISSDKTLNHYLEKLKKGFHFNLFIGRELSSLMEKTGFKNIRARIDVMRFEEKELELEIENYEERFENAKEIFCEILGGKKDFAIFKKLYFRTLKDSKFIFYNKFLVEGTKA